MYDFSDTIVAISTPKGIGGIGVVRLSGLNSIRIFYKLSKKKKINVGVNYASFFNEDGFLIDGGIAIFFKSPKSFTGEDVIELHAHGNDLILDSLVHRCIELGARVGEHGEFSFRAYLNGKIDLLQAEAINALIKSQSLYSNKFIFKSSLGNFSVDIKNILDKLSSLMVSIEGAIEFPEYVDFCFNKFYSSLLELCIFYTKLFDNIRYDNYLFDSLNVVILGNVNVGKSSLFNCLLNRNRSIVSDLPGTTRDFIDSDLFLNGFKFKLVDTAGFNVFSADFLEKISIDRTLDQAKNANILVFVVDVLDTTCIFDNYFFKSIIDNCFGKVKVILVRNKIDLIGLNKKICFHDDYVEIFASVKESYGVDLLISELVSTFSFLHDSLYFVNKRQFNLLSDAKKCFDTLLFIDDTYKPLDFYSDNIKLLCKIFSELIGINVSNDVLIKVFSEFCVGK